MMEVWYWAFGLAALALGVYLLVALFKPEMFQ